MRAALITSLHHTHRVTRPSRRTQFGSGPSPPPNDPAFPNFRSIELRHRYSDHPTPSANHRSDAARCSLW